MKLLLIGVIQLSASLLLYFGRIKHVEFCDSDILVFGIPFFAALAANTAVLRHKFKPGLNGVLKAFGTALAITFIAWYIGMLIAANTWGT